jgi:hypothetical protein
MKLQLAHEFGEDLAALAMPNARTKLRPTRSIRVSFHGNFYSLYSTFKTLVNILLQTCVKERSLECAYRRSQWYLRAYF